MTIIKSLEHQASGPRKAIPSGTTSGKTSEQVHILTAKIARAYSDKSVQLSAIKRVLIPDKQNINT